MRQSWPVVEFVNSKDTKKMDSEDEEEDEEKEKEDKESEEDNRGKRAVTRMKLTKKTKEGSNCDASESFDVEFEEEYSPKKPKPIEIRDFLLKYTEFDFDEN